MEFAFCLKQERYIYAPSADIPIPHLETNAPESSIGACKAVNVPPDAAELLTRECRLALYWSLT